MTGDRPITVMLALCTAVIVGAALYFASSIFAPLAFALLMLAIVWPLQKKLQTLLPKTLALLLTLLVTVVVITVFASMVAWGFSVIGQWMVANAARFQAVYAHWADWLEQHDIFIGAMIAERFDMMWLVRVFHEVAARLNRFAGFALLVFIFLMMMLLEAETFAAKLATSGRPELVQACAEIGWKFRRYMLVRTLLSLLTGLAVWLFARAMGLEPAPAWGIIAFALNYIPFIGPFIATILPGAFAMAQFDSWQSIALIFLGLMVIQFIIGNYLEPLVAGAAVAISPLAVVFAVFFWALLWGIPGALIGVPITIAALVFCRHTASCRWIAELFSGKSEETAIGEA